MASFTARLANSRAMRFSSRVSIISNGMRERSNSSRSCKSFINFDYQSLVSHRRGHFCMGAAFGKNSAAHAGRCTASGGRVYLLS